MDLVAVWMWAVHERDAQRLVLGFLAWIMGSGETTSLPPSFPPLSLYLLGWVGSHFLLL